MSVKIHIAGGRSGSAAPRLLRSQLRIPPGAWMSVSCDCCVLSGRGLCDEPITRPEESCRLCCVVVCDLDTSYKGSPQLTVGRSAKKRIYIYISWQHRLLHRTVWQMGKNAQENLTSFHNLPSQVQSPENHNKYRTERQFWSLVCVKTILESYVQMSHSGKHYLQRTKLMLTNNVRVEDLGYNITF